MSEDDGSMQSDEDSLEYSLEEGEEEEEESPLDMDMHADDQGAFRILLREHCCLPP